MYCICNLTKPAVLKKDLCVSQFHSESFDFQGATLPHSQGGSESKLDTFQQKCSVWDVRMHGLQNEFGSTIGFGGPNISQVALVRVYP